MGVITPDDPVRRALDKASLFVSKSTEYMHAITSAGMKTAV
jgi:hypothetical protein